MKTGILVTKRQLTYEIHWHAVFLKQEARKGTNADIHGIHSWTTSLYTS